VIPLDGSLDLAYFIMVCNMMIQGSQTLWLGSQECFGIEISIAYLSNTQRETTRMEPNDATLSRFMRRQVRIQDKKSSNKSNKG
jgi:hypothetical protein